jgi:hypothetical protein
MKTMG